MTMEVFFMKNGYFKYFLLCLIFLASTLTLPAAVIFSENFNASTSLPTGWTTAQLESERPADRVWRCDNPGGQYVSGGNFSGNFAIYDGSYGGYVTDPNVKTHLTTPVIDCSDHTNVTLAFDIYFSDYYYNHVAANVQVSNDGTNWTVIKNYTTYLGPEFVSFDISEYAAGKSNVQIRWYWDAYAYYYAIDNVQLLSFTDQPLPVTLTTPANNAENLPITTNLNWTPALLGNQPTGYKVYLDTVNPPQEMVYDGVNKTFAPTLGYKKTYYWQVIPYNEHGSAAAGDCEIRTFTTYPAEPLPATAVSPTNNEKDVHPYKSLKWKPQTSGFQPVGYKVYFGTVNPPTTEVYDGANTSFKPELDFNTTYYWRVIPYSSEAPTPTEDCPIWSFKTTKLYNLPYTQAFDGARPAGWKTEELTGNYPNCIWVFNNPLGREPGGNFDDDFAIHDEAHTGRGYGESVLTTPPINSTNAPNLTIAYDEKMAPGWYGARYKVEASADGITWVTLLDKYSYATDAQRIYLNLTSVGANQPTSYVRWNSGGKDGGYLAIDNVEFIVYEGAPHASSLVSPVNGLDNLPLNTKLTWKAPVLGAEITGYRIYLDNVNPPVTYFELGNVLEYSPTLAYGRTYYWQAVPYNTNGYTNRDSCETWSFITYAAAPLPVTLNTPANQAQNVILNSALSWTANAKGIRPTGYKVRLDTVNPPINEEDVGNVLTYAPGFTPDTTYYWRVIPYSADGEAAVEDCVVRSFTSNPAKPLAATLVEPANGSTYISLSQNLKWAHSALGEQATGYKVYMDIFTPPTTEIYDGVATSYSPTLDFDTQYYWQVVPYNAAGDSPNCPIWSFKTSPVFNLPFTENFDASTSLPLGWETKQLEPSLPADRTWRFDNPNGMYVQGNFSGNFAIYDGSYGGYVYSPNVRAILTTPAINCSDASSVTLGFDNYYQHYSTGYVGANVLVSNDGETWNIVKTFDNTTTWDPVSIDISAYAANQKTVYVRWSWDAYAYYWLVDNVIIHGPMAPYAAKLTTPVNEAVNQGTNTTLNWTAPKMGTPPTGYNIYLGEDAELDVDPIDAGNVLTYSPTIKLDTTYYWQVVPYNAVGSASREDCEIRSFTTTHPYPLPATLLTPANKKAHLQPDAVTLTWQANAEGEAATGYKVYLDTNNPPTTEVYDGANLTFAPEGLVVSTKYYWRVIPYNEAASTPVDKCVIFEFTTAQPRFEAGTYVISLNYPEVGDFKTPREAIDHLVNRGINGPVIFNIKPGRYDDDGQASMPPMEITAIPGSSAENTVTFINYDTEHKAIIDISTQPGPDWYNPDRPRSWSFSVNGASNIVFENLYFTRTQYGSNDAYIGMYNGSQNVKVINCNFNFENNDITAVKSEASHNILVEGCTIKGSYSTVSFKGNSTEYATGIVVRNNKFSVTNTAIYMTYVDSFNISGNVMENITQGGSYDANMIIFGYTKGSFLFANNKIFGFSREAIHWGSTGYWFDVEGGHVSDGKPSYFVNNMIGGGPGSKFYNTSVICALRAEAPIHNVHFYYNSFNMDYVGTTYGATNLNLAQNSTGLQFLNNSFAYTGGDSKSTCFMITKPETMITACDYNNYYSNGTAAFVNYGGARTTLAEIQAVDGRNQNSRVGDPEYVSATDLHTYGTQLWKAGTPISAFTKDFDGDARDSSNPCIGADEYMPIIDHDLAAIAIDGPDVITVGEKAEFEITVVNNGRIWQSEYVVKLMKEDDTELASIQINDPIFQDQEVKHIIEWTPTSEDMFDVYGLVVLEGDQLTYNDATEMHSVYIMPLTTLDAPVVTLTLEGPDYGRLSWNAVAGAQSYIVYGTTDLSSGVWTQLKVTDKLSLASPLVAAFGRMGFFKVVASTEPKTILLETPRIRQELKELNKR